MKLFIYEHCPFCIKACMIFNLKSIPVTIEILMNDDIETPTKMIGQKMVPILQKEDGSYLPESLDIIHYIDQLDNNPIVTGKNNPILMQWFQQYQPTFYQLTLPRSPLLPFPEFSTESARHYFIDQKSAKYGDFKTLLNQTPELIKVVNQALIDIEPYIQSSNAMNGVLSEDDFHLLALLTNLSMVKGLEYPEKILAYRNNMAKQCKIPLWDEVAI